MIQVEILSAFPACKECHGEVDEDSRKCDCGGEKGCEWKWNKCLAREVKKKDRDQYIFLDTGVYPEIPFAIPLRLLALHPGGTISHLYSFEEKHLLEEVDFWRTASLPKPIQASGMRWKDLTIRPENLEALPKESHCPQCGEELFSSLESHDKQNTHMKEVVKHIFLGAQWNAFNTIELKHHSIGAVMNCAKEINAQHNATRYGSGYYHVKW